MLRSPRDWTDCLNAFTYALPSLVSSTCTTNAVSTHPLASNTLL